MTRLERELALEDELDRREATPEHRLAARSLLAWELYADERGPAVLVVVDWPALHNHLADRPRAWEP